jgi:hypothetical protein
MPGALVLSLADLEATDPRPSGRGDERRFCCPLPACAEKPRDRAHQSLGANTATRRQPPIGSDGGRRFFNRGRDQGFPRRRGAGAGH